MKTQLKFNVVTEQDLSLIARLLLILNRKQIELNTMTVDSNYYRKYYSYQIQVSGNNHMLQQALKVIEKQIGVLHVKTNTNKLFPSIEMAIA